MREIFRGASKLAVTGLLTAFIGTQAQADSNFINQNISGFNLPGVTLPSGSDEVRAADGTTCRSAVGGNGAYIDVGIIGNPEMNETSGSMSAYGRIVMPLGEKPKRVDCTRLYDLEIQRLEMELKLAQMGLAQGISPVSDVDDSSDEEEPQKQAATSAKADAFDDKSEVSEIKVASVAKPKSSSKDISDADWVNEGWSKEGLKK